MRSRSYTAFGARVCVERFGLQQRYVAMSDLTPETRPRGQTGLLIATVLVIVVAIVAGLVWKQTRDRSGPGSTTAASQTAPAQNRSTTVSQNTQGSGSSDTSLDQLKEQVKDLEAARQSLAQQLDATKQQLSQDEGDIKLLSQQLGGLSERVDGLSGSRASMPRGEGASRRKRSQAR